MTSSRKDIAQIQERVFREAVTSGVTEAGQLILRLSSKAVKEVRTGPVSALSVKLDKTIQVFVHDVDTGTMRYSTIAAPMVKKVLTRRGAKFSSFERGHRLAHVGKSFGYMIGTAVFSSVAEILASAGSENIQGRGDLSDDAKRFCVNYVHDALGYILLNLSSLLDRTYRVSPKDREIFSQILLEIEEEATGMEASPGDEPNTESTGK